jgi:hypothetical protein
MARRGLAGAILLAVPVMVAATIGLSGGFSAVSELPALAFDAPSQAEDASRSSGGELDLAIASSASPPVPADEAPGGPGRSPGGGGETGGGGGVEAGGGGGDTGGGAPPDTGAPVEAPDLGLPDEGLSSDPVGSLVDGLNQTVNGLLGGQ